MLQWRHMKIIGFLILIILIAGGVYYYNKQHGVTGDPLTQYQNIIKLPTAQQASALVSSVKAWVQDPIDNTSYPKGWQHSQMTIQGQTFTIITSDPSIPPGYYVSFNFPKSLIPSQHLIKCLGTPASDTTSTCLVGDNPEIDAYYNIVAWLKQNSATVGATASSVINH